MEANIIFQGKTDKDLEVLVRYPKMEDLPVMLEYINTLSKERTYITFQGEEITEDYEKKYLDNLLERIKEKRGVTLYALSDGQLVGMISISLKDLNQSHVGYLGISIKKEFRGKGLGNLLMELVLKDAKDNLVGLKTITLDVYANNPIAPNLYKKFGFKEYGRLPRGIKWRDELVDEIMMYKEV